MAAILSRPNVLRVPLWAADVGECLATYLVIPRTEHMTSGVPFTNMDSF